MEPRTREESVKEPGPLKGPDVRPHLREAGSFGVTTGRAVDGVRTIEFTTDPAVHGAHGRVDARCTVAPSRRRLTAEVHFGDRGWARCESRHSIRVWGRFAPTVEVRIGAAAVRLVARTPEGDVLAGPVVVRPDETRTVLAW
jgi:hypothetical protein